MRAAGLYLTGEHDFAAFAAAGYSSKTTVRTIYSLTVDGERNGMITLSVTGNGFLYNMVRIIAGTLIEVGKGEYPPEHVAEILESRSRKEAGPTAPAHGLTLVNIEYPALEGDADCGGIVSVNYLAGEHLTETEVGRPMVVRLPDGKMTASNFMRAQLNAAIATLALGMQMLQDKEQVESDMLLGHGGFFKTPVVGQQILANALNVPISTMETAGEGGPWGMALLAAYMVRKCDGESMEDYLANRVFADAKRVTVQPDPEGVAGFKTYLKRYQTVLSAEKAAGAMQ